MKKQGTVVKWDDARGFGFLRSPGTSSDIFFHVRDFRAAGGVMPRSGLAVTFEEIHVGGKGPRAMAVQPANAPVAPATVARPRPRQPSPSRVHHAGAGPESGALIALPLMAIYAAALLWGVSVGRLPGWTLPLAFGINVFTFYAYWLDKWAAGRGHWRTPEKTLHAFSTAGGWAGAWFAQQVLRHKSRKEPFRSTYWTTVVLHCGALGAWLFGALIMRALALTAR
jgi:uncharacterized membrane protein YsdA (DUF1294 family)/cold shock CspA family protein